MKSTSGVVGFGYTVPRLAWVSCPKHQDAGGESSEGDTSSSVVTYKSESVVGWGGTVVAAQHNVKFLAL